VVEPRNRTILYALILTFVATIAVGVNSVVYANHEGRRAQHAAEASAATNLAIMCGAYVLLDQLYTAMPPTTQVGTRFAAEVHHIVIALHCDQHQSPITSLSPSVTPSAPTPAAS
jgi:hypothetical protein